MSWSSANSTALGLQPSSFLPIFPQLAAPSTWSWPGFFVRAGRPCSVWFAACPIRVLISPSCRHIFPVGRPPRPVFLAVSSWSFPSFANYESPALMLPLGTPLSLGQTSSPYTRSTLRNGTYIRVHFHNCPPFWSFRHRVGPDSIIVFRFL